MVQTLVSKIQPSPERLRPSSPANDPSRKVSGTPAASSTSQDRAFQPGFLALQVRTFALTWLSYSSYYFTRKNLSVCKSRLHDDLGLSMTALGSIDTLYLASYALGMFLSGTLGDRIGARRLLTIGMLGSAAVAVWFGLSSSLLAFALAFSLNGAFQSTGWPGNVKAMQPFFSQSTRGRVMGLWTTNYQVGGLIATALATYVLTHYGWRAAFIGPATWVALIGITIFTLLVERPEDRGFAPVEPLLAPRPEATAAAAAAQPAPPEESLLALFLRMPILWALGSAYFALKMIRYSLLFWLPYYLRQHLHYDEAAAGYGSMPFEIGGVIGSISVGWLSDRYFRTRRLKLSVPLLFVLGVALLAYQRLGGMSLLVNALVLGVCGFLLFGPDSLLSGTMAQDLGGRKATARVAGIINGMGSTGAIFSPILVAVIKEHLGWSALFYSFFLLTLLAGSLLGVAAWLHTNRPQVAS